MEKSVELFYREGSSDKVYQASIEKKGKGFVVNFAFGRRGSTLKTGTKTQDAVDSAEAVKIYDALIGEKMKKGYKPVEGDVSNYNHVDKDQLQTGVYCQLLNPIEEDEIEKYLTDNDYIAQPKFDGKRCLFEKKKDKLVAINRKGLSVGYPKAFDFCQDMKVDFLIDGEAIGDELYVFDILEYNGIDLRVSSVEERLQQLKDLFKHFKKSCFILTETAETNVEKKKLFKRLKDENAEGIVFKKRTAKYSAGRPASGGNHIKFKFVATASFEVTKVNKKRSVAVALYDIKSGDRIDVGNVTIPPNKDVPAKGDIIEVQYLYAFKGGSIYQPVYLNKRDDLDWKDCKLSQLKYKAETAEIDEEA